MRQPKEQDRVKMLAPPYAIGILIAIDPKQVTVARSDGTEYITSLDKVVAIGKKGEKQ